MGGGFRRSRPGLLLHRSRNLEPNDAATAQDIPTTAVSRTLLDLADVVGARHLRRAFEDAERLRLLDLRSLRDVRARSPGRRGLRVFDAVLAEIEVPPDTRSELERLFFELCRENGLPLPETNAVVAGFEVDALWPRHRLIVELDGYAYHRTRAAFERDRKRDAALQLAGYRVLRITFRRLLEEPELVAEEIRRLLAQGA